MAKPVEVKIGDVGTVYFTPIFDNDLAEANFDPSAATVKQLIFRMPGAETLLVRDAEAVQKTIGGVATWGLQYTVVAEDVVPYVSESEGGFHQESGPVRIEAYLEFSADQKWASSTVTEDQEERPLRVSKRLSA